MPIFKNGFKNFQVIENIEKYTVKYFKKLKALPIVLTNLLKNQKLKKNDKFAKNLKN